MALLDDMFRDLADELIYTLGADAVLVRRREAYAPETGERTVKLPEEWPVKIVPPEERKSEREGTTTAGRTFTTYLAASALAGKALDGSELEVKTGMMLRYNGKEHRIVDVVRTAGDAAILWTIVCEL